MINDLPLPAAQILNLVAAAQPETALARTIGRRDVFWRLHNDATGREIRPRHVFQQRIIPGVGCFDQMDAGVTQF